MESRALYDQPTTRYQPPSPIWRDFKTWRGSELPHGHRRWLLDQGSLTERLLAASRRRLAVEVLQQRWQRASTSEYRLLAIPHRQHCLVREVLLHCAGRPWVSWAGGSGSGLRRCARGWRSSAACARRGG